MFFLYILDVDCYLELILKKKRYGNFLLVLYRNICDLVLLKLIICYLVKYEKKMKIIWYNYI